MLTNTTLLHRAYVAATFHKQDEYDQLERFWTQFSQKHSRLNDIKDSLRPDEIVRRLES